jgi:hypothetical protein
MLAAVDLGMYRFQVRRTLQFDSNKFIDWWLAKCVVYIVRSAIRQYVIDINLAISVNSSFSHAGHAVDRLILPA